MHVQDLTARASRRVSLQLFFLFFLLNLLLAGGSPPWADGKPIYEAAESLVHEGSFATRTHWPVDSPPGRYGKFYAWNPIVTTLVHVPGVWFGDAYARLWNSPVDLLVPLSSRLAAASSGALTCLLFYLLCRRHEISARLAVALTALLGTGTAIFIYARQPYTEILQAAAFTGVVLSTVDLLRSPTARRGAWLGLWGAVLINVKTVFFLALPGPVLLLAWGLRRDLRRFVIVSTPIAGGFALGVAATLAYNWVRFGSFTNTGYSSITDEFFGRGRFWVGLWGLFLSPGKCVFLYSPVLLLLPMAIGRFAGRHRSSSLVLLVTVAPIVCLYASFAFWHGDWAYGPRYMAFVVPALLLPVAHLFSEWFRSGRRLVASVAFVVVSVAGLFVQFVGANIHWDRYVALAMRARVLWLGDANRTGAVSAGGRPFCMSPCFEDIHGLNWLPQFQPIYGHWWLTRHLLAGHGWAEAEKDAPWKPDTTLFLDLAPYYNFTAPDWWWLSYKGRPKAEPRLRGILLGAGILLCTAGLVRNLRRSRKSLPDPL